VLREMTTPGNRTGHFEAATSTTTTSYCVTVTVAWSVPRRRPTGMKGSWEYVAQTVPKSRQGVVFQLGGWLRSKEIKTQK
jgi:hypothetical protein